MRDACCLLLLLFHSPVPILVAITVGFIEHLCQASPFRELSGNVVAPSSGMAILDHVDDLRFLPSIISTPKLCSPTSSLVGGLSPGYARLNLSTGTAHSHPLFVSQRFDSSFASVILWAVWVNCLSLCLPIPAFVSEIHASHKASNL